MSDTTARATFLDARFAGGAVEVHTSTLDYDPDQGMVNILFPDYQVALFPHEARALAAALLEQEALA